MDKIVILILVAALGIIFALVPSRTYNILTKTLSFDKKGIRYIRRRHDKVDALANLFLFIGLIFSVFYFVLPFYSLIYAVFLIFSFLCVLGQANRVLKKKNRNVYRIVIYGLYLMAAIGLVSALGLLNNHVADMMVTTYRTDLFAGMFLIFSIFWPTIVLSFISCREFFSLFLFTACGHNLNICVWKILIKQWISLPMLLRCYLFV